MVIKIGNADVLTASNFEFIPDDRQEITETIGGIIVQDFGRVPEGDKFSCSVEVTTPNAEIIFSYWNNRTLITLIDGTGNIHQNIRVLVKKYSYIDNFEDKGYTIDLEFWRK